MRWNRECKMFILSYFTVCVMLWGAYIGFAAIPKTFTSVIY